MMIRNPNRVSFFLAFFLKRVYIINDLKEEKKYMDYFNEIKNLIEKQEVNEHVRKLQSNNEMIKTYYEIGKLLVEAQGKEKRAKYGEGLLKKWSKLLSK